MKSRSLIFLLFALQASTSFGQLTENYFRDVEGKHGGSPGVVRNYDKAFIIAGSSFDRFFGQPTVTKTDLEGNVLWTTATLDKDTYNGGLANDVIISDDKIYVSFNYSGVGEIWKVDIASGIIEWKAKNRQIYYGAKLVDYDETRFLTTYISRDEDGVYRRRIRFIDKATGNELSSILVRVNETSEIGVAVDSNKDIYYTKGDSLFKVSGSNPTIELWGARHASSNIGTFQKIYIDPNNNVFLFGTPGFGFFARGKILSFNKDDGNFLWEAVTTDNGVDCTFSCMVDDGNNIVVGWSPIYSGDNNMWTAKIAKSSGNILWRSTYNFENSDSESVKALTLDEVGDVLMTGTHQTGWAFVKLQGSTGVGVYETTIKTDTIPNQTGAGNAIYYADGIAHLIGSIELRKIRRGLTSYERLSAPAIISFNPSSKEIVSKKYLLGNFEYPSRTVAIEKYSDTQTVQLKQVGRITKVGLYDGVNQVWEKSMSGIYGFEPCCLSVGSDGTVSVSGLSNIPSWYITNSYQAHDSVHNYTFDRNGALVSSGRFNFEELGAVQENVFPLETIKTGDGLFFLYRLSQELYLRKFQNGVYTRIDLNMFMFDSDLIKSRTKSLVQLSDNEILVLGITGSQAVKVNTTTMTKAPVQLHAFLKRMNYVEKFNDSTLLIGGKSNNGKDMLLRYNFYRSTAAWVGEYGSSSEIYKVIVSDDKTAIYTTGVVNDNLFVRRIDATTGGLVWSYIYNHDASLKDLPLDLAGDFKKNKLILVGRNDIIADPDLPSNLFVHTITTSGVHDNIMIRQGEVGKSSASSVVILPNDKIYIGGNVNQDGHKEGFLFTTEASLGCTGQVEANVSVSNGALIASDENAIYQWTNCDTGLKVDGATEKSFIPFQSAHYSVNVSKSGCERTSACTDFFVCSDLQGIVSIDGDNLEVSDNGATYEWKACETDLSIPGATGKTFTPVATGTYQVTVSRNDCTITSSCVNFTVVANCDALADATITSGDDHLTASTYDLATYQWIDCSTNAEIAGAVSPTFKPKSSGNYAVRITNGCSFTTLCFPFTVSEITGLEDIETKLSMYPNPASQQVIVSFGIQLDYANVLLKNVNGVIISQQKVNGSKEFILETKDLSTGVYVVQVIADNYSAIRKLVIE